MFERVGFNTDLQSQVSILLEMVKRNEAVYEILGRSPEFELPGTYVGAGCITQTVWNALSGFPLLNNIKDVDFVYFDPSDLTEDSENAVQERVREKFRDFPLQIDVNNEARVHLWYESKFGCSIRPYKSSEDAINTWPTTATSIALSAKNGQLNVYAPFGLNDLFGMIARANKTQITEEIYLDKVERWKKHWPNLTVIPWKELG